MRIDAGACVLRPWRADDLEALVRLADDPRVAANLRDRFPSPYTRADGERWLGIAAALPDGEALAVEAGGALAGGIGLVPGDDIERVAGEVGYWLGVPFWGRGVATAAVRAYSAGALEAFGLERLFAKVFADHAASCRVLEKAGYTREGVLRRAAVKAGVVHDLAVYARLRGE
ncbi:MAG: GNAT family N-acetyltransferase [Gemmataceae bacterium]